jgi:putative flippase GtrA
MNLALFRPILRQFGSFFGVGLIAAVAHYGVLIGLVELAGVDPVAATLAGFLFGGSLSYALNRRLTYVSDRPHREAAWRFALVTFVGFLLTGALMYLFTRWLGTPYLTAQLVTTGIVLFWSFLGHKLWTFRSGPAR